MQAEVDSFFNEIKAGRYRQAMTHTSKNFQSTVSAEGLKRAFPQKRFAKFASTSFANREVNADGTGKLSGKVEFADGSSMAIEVRLIKENDQWKIDHINLPKSGISHKSELTPSVRPSESGQPSKAAVQKSVREVLVAFAEGVGSGDFSRLYALTADQFKMRYPDSDLFKGAFEKFKQSGIDWHTIETINPTIEKIEPMEGGEIRVYGFVPSKPEKLGFILGFIPQEGTLRLLEIKAATFQEE